MKAFFTIVVSALVFVSSAFAAEDKMASLYGWTMESPLPLSFSTKNAMPADVVNANGVDIGLSFVAKAKNENYLVWIYWSLKDVPKGKVEKSMTEDSFFTEVKKGKLETAVGPTDIVEMMTTLKSFDFNGVEKIFPAAFLHFYVKMPNGRTILVNGKSTDTLRFSILVRGQLKGSFEYKDYDEVWVANTIREIAKSIELQEVVK